MEYTIEPIDEKITEWGKWLEENDSLTLEQLKLWAKYWGEMAESLNNERSHNDSIPQFMSRTSDKAFHNCFAFMAYRTYAKRLEKELMK